MERRLRSAKASFALASVCVGVFTSVIFSILLSTTLHAQNRYDVLRYVTTMPGSDAVSTAFGGATTAFAPSLGASIDNPAAMGMIKSSEFSFGVNNRRISEQTNFYQSDLSLLQGTLSLSDAGFIYVVPTVQGNMVFGGGYVRNTDFFRGHQIYGFNPDNTITDSFSNSNSPYYDLAFRKAYFDFDDGDYSILRFADFVGINQDAEQTEAGQMGELNFYGAFEAAKNLFVGASVSVPFGFYRYRRYWLEEDIKGDYWGEFYASYPNGDKFYDDVRDIYTVDEIDATIAGWYARVGVVYKVQPWLNVGASFRTRTTMAVREEYFSSLEMNFDNGDFVGPEQLEGNVSYRVKNPGRINVGAAIDNLNGFSLSGSAEYAAFSTAELRFAKPNADDVSYARAQNREIQREFNDVWNLKLGAGYDVGLVTPMIGFAHYPAVSKDFGNDINIYSGGVQLKLNQELHVNIAGTYSRFDDVQTMYQTINESANANTTVQRVQIVGGLVFKF